MEIVKPKKKKVLIITFNFPYPLTHGGAIAQFYFLEKLQNDFDITILTISNSIKKTEEYKKLIDILPALKLVIFENFLKERKSFIRRFLNPINIIRAIFLRIKRHIWYGFSIPFIEPEFKKFLTDHLFKQNYDIYQVEFVETFPVLNLIKKTSDNLIFVHHELMSKTRENEKINSPDLIQKVFKYEMTKLSKVYKVIVFNYDDKERIKKYVKSVIVSPFAIPDTLITKEKVSKRFNRLIFIGGESHTANKMGLKFFLDEIYIPYYSSEFFLPLLIIGHWSETFQKDYEEYDRIKFSGFLETIDHLYDESILISPIFCGSGLRTKILLALANKIPVLTMPFAAEGLYENQEQGHLGFFENATDFIQHLKKQDRDSYFNNMAKMGFEYYNINFNSEKLLESRYKAYR